MLVQQQQQLNLIVYTQYFIILVRINRQQLIAIVDSNATNNFIVKTFVKKKYFT